jgi:glutathione synthase/RimK-type ligase-like ATP-grasp enzyme/ribosomal protein S18 acetylase RimI-like enzyme
MIRFAGEHDLAFIHGLEMANFPPSSQLSKRDIKHSLRSPHQLVYILEEHGVRHGYMIVIEYKRSMRLYSIVVEAASRNKGYGHELVRTFVQLGEERNKHLTLEVNAAKERLVAFYESFGFVKTRTLANYYGPSQHAWKMRKAHPKSPHQTIVVEKELSYLKDIPHTRMVLAHEYMNNPSFHDEHQRIVNLCEHYRYQSLGYYVSLLAVARNQIVTPALTTIKDRSNRVLLQSVAQEIHDCLQEELRDASEKRITFPIYFGTTPDPRYRALAHELFAWFDLPLCQVRLVRYDHWVVESIKAIAPSTIPSTHQALVRQGFQSFQRRRSPQDKYFKPYDYDLAILVNPKEVSPPSDEAALQEFKKAAERIGFYVEFIGPGDYRRVTEFDALFLRETTDVNHHTYDFSRYAFAEGLVVIDDPWSILKCSNKVFLYELLDKHRIPIPATRIVTKNNRKDRAFESFGYPLIMKRPDSSFSRGVFKVHDHADFLAKSNELLKHSDMILIQEYIETTFDWRIGVLHHEVLFACKYHMIPNDFRIIDYDSDGQEIESLYEGIDLADVPPQVIDLAIQSCRLIGDGLYGVDIKQRGDACYVIEINDNPSIDHGIEDKVLGPVLYDKIMREFYRRIEFERGRKRILR